MITTTRTNPQPKSGRVEWADTARGICIFFLLVSHQTVKTDLSLIFSPFYMPLFFFVSGYLYRFKGVATFKRIARGLLLPYIILTYLRFCLAPVFLRNIVAGTLGNYFLKITDSMIEGRGLWFIACLILVQVCYTLINFFIKKISFSSIAKLIIASLGFLSILFYPHDTPGYLLWNIDTVPVALGFFILGDLFKNIDVSKMQSSKQLKIFSLIILVCYLIIVLNFERNVDFIIDVHRNLYVNPLLSMALMIFSCSTVLLFSIMWNCGAYIKALGRNTLVIYALHGFWGLGITAFVLQKLNITDFTLSPIMYTLLVAFIASINLLFISFIINKYFPFIIGRTKQ